MNGADARTNVSHGCACKSAFVQPQRGCGFQPRVGAKRLPWVNGEGKVSQPQRGCATPSDIGHNPVGVVQNFCTPAPKVAFGATLGFATQPLWGRLKPALRSTDATPTERRTGRWPKMGLSGSFALPGPTDCLYSEKRVPGAPIPIRPCSIRVSSVARKTFCFGE